MYLVKNYLTDETVAIVTRKEDAVALTRDSGKNPNEPRLIYVEENSR